MGDIEYTQAKENNKNQNQETKNENKS